MHSEKQAGSPNEKLLFGFSFLFESRAENNCIPSIQICCPHLCKMILFAGVCLCLRYYQIIFDPLLSENANRAAWSKCWLRYCSIILNIRSRVNVSTRWCTHPKHLTCRWNSTETSGIPHSGIPEVKSTKYSKECEDSRILEFLWIPKKGARIWAPVATPHRSLTENVC